MFELTLHMIVDIILVDLSGNWKENVVEAWSTSIKTIQRSNMLKSSSDRDDLLRSRVLQTRYNVARMKGRVQVLMEFRMQ